MFFLFFPFLHWQPLGSCLCWLSKLDSQIYNHDTTVIELDFLCNSNNFNRVFKHNCLAMVW
jgi:hypothetical protein